MFALKTLRSRLLALGAASLFGLLMAGGFGLFQLARLDRGVAIDLAQMGRAVDIVLDVQNAGIDFKTLNSSSVIATASKRRLPPSPSGWAASAPA
jgi:methyl-accepting chemotaxis protein